MSTETKVVVDTSYTDANVKTLKDAAHIRQNPGMYVGNTSSSGLHHIVYEVVYNSVDEALVGYCKQIKIVLHVDGSCTVADDGRGIPVGIKAETGRSTLEEVLTVAGSSGKFDNAAYRVSAGLHGMGAKAMNALSEWCEAEVRRDGRVYQMTFERGYAKTKIKDIGPSPVGVTGTTIRFMPDKEIFGDLTFVYDMLADRFRQIAYLNRGLNISILDEREGRSDVFYTEAGIADYVAYLNRDEKVVHNPPIYARKDVDGVLVEVSIQYTISESQIEECFANNAYNRDGGTHLTGFRSGLTRAVTKYGKDNNIFKEGIELRGDDFREGLTAVISIAHPDPIFESQIKVRLNNPEVDGIVSSVVYEFLTDYLEKNPKEGTLICKRVILSAEARIAAKKARENIKIRSGILNGGGLPGKLMDCTTRERDKSELFLVEGDSAGGSAESGRDRMYQAVLPLRGKVLNVERAKLEKLLKNEEITNLISAIGIDIGNDTDIAKVRYGKIVILTDADVDGQHIRTLLLTFFFRQMRKLIENGNLYVARPPLFKVTQKREVRFVQTRAEMGIELMSRGLKDTTLVVSKDATARTLVADELKKLFPVIEEIDTASHTLERRGHTLESFLKRYDRAKGGCPMFHVRFGVKDHLFYSQDEVEAFRSSESTRLGREIAISDAVLAVAAPATLTTDANAKPVTPAEEVDRFTTDEWHEVRGLNRGMAKLIDAGFQPSDLIPLPRIAGREPPIRFTLRSGESERDLLHLRMLASEVRRNGEKGMTITRFKGLGEMDPDELWKTTLDPEHRTLLRVTMTDAIAAEKMFRTLMGEEVEGRREFILKHRVEDPNEIDYGA